jgi:uncharacterized protein YqgC (DUF456 family)
VIVSRESTTCTEASIGIAVSSTGELVGADVGVLVGAFVGALVGTFVGALVGDFVGGFERVQST